MKREPGTAPTAPARAHAPTRGQLNLPRLKLVALPASEMGMMSASDEPTATGQSNLQSRTMTGAMMMPPAMRQQPLAKPAKSPSRT